MEPGIIKEDRLGLDVIYCAGETLEEFYRKSRDSDFYSEVPDFLYRGLESLINQVLSKIDIDIKYIDVLEA